MEETKTEPFVTALSCSSITEFAEKMRADPDSTAKHRVRMDLCDLEMLVDFWLCLLSHVEWQLGQDASAFMLGGQVTSGESKEGTVLGDLMRITSGELYHALLDAPSRDALSNKISMCRKDAVGGIRKLLKVYPYAAHDTNTLADLDHMEYFELYSD